MKKFIKLFNKVGGKEILRQYRQGHVLLYAMMMTLMLGFSKKSLEILRLAVNNKLLKRLRKKYKKFISQFVKRNNNYTKSDSSSRKVWVCWFQGIENAPDIVKKCYSSLKENIKDREIVVITNDNYKDYVQFPAHIQEKIDNKTITMTHMSDLLRLELLIKYGGTWIDATVLTTGKIPDYMLDSDLFFFQNLKPGLNGACTCLSSWFLTSKKDNNVLKLTRALLYEYWKHNNKLVHYFLLHDFFQLALEAYPDEWNNVIPCSNSTPHILLLRLFEKYNDELWTELQKQTSIHKITYKFDETNAKKKDTYYDVILN